MTSEREVSIQDNGRQLELRVGDDRAGFVVYTQTGVVRTFTHTVILPAFEHQGLGKILAKAALDDARANEYEVSPLCPFIAAFIREHAEYLNLTVPSVSQRLSAQETS